MSQTSFKLVGIELTPPTSNYKKKHLALHVIKSLGGKACIVHHIKQHFKCCTA